MILYFSGTGNSRYAAKFLADRLADDLLDIGKEIKQGIEGHFRSVRPWIFVSPTYGWRIPHVFADYLRNAELAGNRDAYFVLTCGSDIGNAGSTLEELCVETGLNYRGVLEVVMPENYIALFPVPDVSEAKQIIDRAIPVLQQGADLIEAEIPFPDHRISFIDRLKSGWINHLFYRFVIKSKAFYSKDTCIGCGACVEACPLNNITFSASRPLWGNCCTHCMACICGCPTNAIEYGKQSQNKPRYRCPDYQADQSD